MKKYIKLMRPHHCIKNLLIFLALFCSGELFDSTKLISVGMGFISFSLVASSVYIINDIMDRKKDRNHPTKCRRPIASGEVSVKRAVGLTIFLIVAAFLCSVAFMSYIRGVILLVIYMIINIFYSMGLKNIPIVDVAILASGFFIRILFGGIITDIEISNWEYKKEMPSWCRTVSR